MSVFRNLLMQSTGWLGKPADWSDIRKDCPKNSIALYAGVKSDYSAYDNLGFTATCVGGYKVYIDETLYGTYNSGAQCNITWSTSGITTGDDITTPSALKAHKIWIEPATEGNNITAFRCNRVAASGNEYQGVLWAHFNITNTINIGSCFGNPNTYRNNMLKAITSKNNLLSVSQLSNAFQYSSSLQYTPVFLGYSSYVNATSAFQINNIIPNISFKDIEIRYVNNAFNNCNYLEKIKTSNSFFNLGSDCSNAFYNCYRLKTPIMVDFNYANATNMTDFMRNCSAIEDMTLDVRAASGLTKIGCYGSSQYFMSGFKGLHVSNEAPFDNANAPQINVSYTGLDRAALVQLFNDLPSVSGGQIINVLGATGASDLTSADEAIATAKGWTITK